MYMQAINVTNTFYSGGTKIVLLPSKHLAAL